MIEWLDAEGTKYLILAVIALGGMVTRQTLQRLDRMSDKLDRLHDDMVRVKERVGVHTISHEAE